MDAGGLIIRGWLSLRFRGFIMIFFLGGGGEVRGEYSNFTILEVPVHQLSCALLTIHIKTHLPLSNEPPSTLSHSPNS